MTDETPRATAGETHEWDRDGERCVKCGAKDWMGGPRSSTPARPESGEVWLEMILEAFLNPERLDPSLMQLADELGPDRARAQGRGRIAAQIKERLARLTRELAEARTGKALLEVERVKLYEDRAAARAEAARGREAGRELLGAVDALLGRLNSMEGAVSMSVTAAKIGLAKSADEFRALAGGGA